jgi:hypothetical protein
MKTIVTLLFSFGIFATSFAQGDHGQFEQNGQYVYGQKNYYNKGHFPYGERQFQIEKINREFDYKIRAIENDYALRRHQKKVATRIAERERERQIRRVNARFR